MEKKRNKGILPTNSADRVLTAGTAYTIGKFNVFLDEVTGDLKVSVHTNREDLKIQPKSDNSIILHAL